MPLYFKFFRKNKVIRLSYPGYFLLLRLSQLIRFYFFKIEFLSSDLNFVSQTLFCVIILVTKLTTKQTDFITLSNVSTLNCSSLRLHHCHNASLKRFQFKASEHIIFSYNFTVASVVFII